MVDAERVDFIVMQWVHNQMHSWPYVGPTMRQIRAYRRRIHKDALKGIWVMPEPSPLCVICNALAPIEEGQEVITRVAREQFHRVDTLMSKIGELEKETDVPMKELRDTYSTRYIDSTGNECRDKEAWERTESTLKRMRDLLADPKNSRSDVLIGVDVEIARASDAKAESSTPRKGSNNGE